MSLEAFIGLDDTDTLDHPGTNHLARHLVRKFGSRERPSMVTRHQLLKDPRVPCTRMNGCVAVRMSSRLSSIDELRDAIRAEMLGWCPAGSDPGLCVTTNVADEVTAFGRRCQTEFVTQAEARSLAGRVGLQLEGLGGTQDGVIGALAALGLHATGDDGRVVHFGHCESEPFEIDGMQTAATVFERGVSQIVRHDDASAVVTGVIDLGKRLRPNLRSGGVTLFVLPIDRTTTNLPTGVDWQAVRVV